MRNTQKNACFSAVRVPERLTVSPMHSVMNKWLAHLTARTLISARRSVPENPHLERLAYARSSRRRVAPHRIA
ncbi:hypothetical protein PSP6_490107 [Paraburkholderia tropica]|nr:hypothetical protein PSP6_490107 [Paraburkholderia tropica]